MRPACVSLLCIVLASCDSAPPPDPTGVTVFVGRIFDGTEAFMGAVEIDADGVVSAVHREVPSTVEGTRVDLGDGTLLPGLIDLHTHVTAAGGTVRTVPVDDHEPNLKAMLRAGVTSFLHLGGMARVSFEIRDRERAGELLSPRMFSVGPFLDPPASSHCPLGVQQFDHCVSIATPEQAERVVGELERIYDPDVIKITNDSGFTERPSQPYDPATLRALVSAAGSTPIVAHIRNVRDIDASVAAGVGAMTHLPFDERFTLDQARAWVEAGTVFIPTLGLHQREADLMNGEANLDDPTLAHDAPASVIAELRAFSEAPHDATSRARVLEVQANVLANFAVLLEADAVILSGSDAGIFGSIHGRSLVDELVAFVDNGMPNAQALASATALAADYLGRGDLGRITVGATADLLIVDGDPTVSIDALRSVRAVYLGGRALDREALEVHRALPLETDPARRAPDDGHCLRVSECAASQTCTRLYLCADRCADSSECAAGTFCGRDIADGRGCYPSWDCDPLAQNCGNGLACQPMSNGATFCGAAGSAGIGEPCDNASLATTCARGARCEAGACEALCALAGSDCAAPQTCVSLEAETGVAVGACR